MMFFSRKRLLVYAAVLYVAACVLFFSPASLNHKVVWPVLIAATFALRLAPLPMAAGLFFSALGDYMGADHNFLGQMGSFAVAHVMYIIYFYVRAREPRLSFRVGDVCRYVALMALAVLSLSTIVPQAPAGLVRIGTAVYTLLILTMFFFASKQIHLLFGVGAALFVVSDLVLAWNRFVSPVDDARWWIMLTYYAAQLLFFVCAARTRSSESLLASSPASTL